MDKRPHLSLLFRGTLIVLAIDLGLIAIVALIGRWSGWTNLEDFKRAIQIAGFLVIGLGLMGIKGNLDMSRSFEYQYSMSVTKDDSWQRTQQTLIDLARCYAFTLVMTIAGIISLLIGWFL
jgi:hypothetical protein